MSRQVIEGRTLFEGEGFIVPGVTALDMGAPGTTRLSDCGRILQQATLALIQDPDVASTGCAFQYGPRLGDPEFRAELAKLINNASGGSGRCKPEDLMLTCGATHGLQFLSVYLFCTGDMVFVEDPTYFIAIRMLREDLGMNIITVPTDDNGTDVDSLDELLTKHRQVSKAQVTADRPFWSMVYVIPTYNNPTGGCLAPERCRKLVQVARKHDVLILCDDVYVMLHYSCLGNKPHPKRLLEYDDPADSDYRGGNVISNGSFSKILAPGVRVGWLEAAPRIISLLKKSNYIWSGGATNHYMSMVLTSAMKLGLCQEQISVLNADYGARMAMVLSMLRENLPPSVKFSQPTGGYFVWISLPENMETEELLNLSRQKYKLTFLPGPRFSPSGGFRNCLRISISFYEVQILQQAIKSLCDAITEFVDSKKKL